MAQNTHRWTFFRAGGVDQVVLQTAEDIIHLDQLDAKLWIALSMPTRGVELDPKTLDLLDTDHDTHIRQAEVLEAIRWVRATYKDPAHLLQGGEAVPLGALADGPVLAGAKRMLSSLGKADAKEITLGDASSGEKLYANTRFNGDGIIPVDAAEGDTCGVIEDIIKTHGSTPDRSAKPGIDAARADAFFAEAKAHVAWNAKATGDVLPLGDATGAAADAVRAVRDKIDDYFTRCRMAAYDPRAAVALGGADAELAALSPKQLSAATPEIASLPLAKIEVGCKLPLEAGVNPAWSTRIAELAARAVTPIVGARPVLTEADWQTITARLAAHAAWRGDKPAGAVEQLGLARLTAILAADHAATIARLIEQDLAVKAEVDAAADVEKLCRYQRDLFKLLKNYVNFAEFYGKKAAVFQAGTVYLDGRGCNLVVEVTDATKHALMGPMAGAYLAYCDCVRPGEKRQVAAAFTDGDTDNLMVGRNGVFVDRQGRDWEATIVKVVDNPISIRQAFWSPYKKLVRKVEENVAKRAAAEEAAQQAKLDQAAAEVAHIDKAAPVAAAAVVAPPEQPKKIDLGAIAAVGLAIGGVGSLLGAFLGLGAWIPVGLVAVMLMISGPSMVLAFLKLRKRNLGPLLDANGWAINALTRINVPFGKALTDLGALPANSRRTLNDPFAEKGRPWKLYIALAVVLALAVTWYLGKLDNLLPGMASSESVLGDNAPIVKARKHAQAAAAKAETPAPAGKPAAK
jgi:hypothetical protein